MEKSINPLSVKVTKIREYSRPKHPNKQAKRYLTARTLQGEPYYKVWDNESKRIYGYFVGKEKALAFKAELLKGGVEPIKGANYTRSLRVAGKGVFYYDQLYND